MVNKYFFIASFLFWLLPAIVRLCVIDISEIAISHTTTFEINSPANKTLYFLYNEVTKRVYFIGNERMLIAHDSNRLRFS